MQGRDLTPFLSAAVASDWRSDFLYEHLFEHPGIPKSEGVVGNRYKYIRYWRDRDEYEELFDLRSDHNEICNLATAPTHRNVLETLRARTRQLIADAT